MSKLVSILLLISLVVACPGLAQEKNPDKAAPEYVKITQEALIPFNEHLSKNLQYPELAQKMKLNGKVIMEFFITPEGELKNIRVIESLGAGCDEEAIRVLSTAPKFFVCPKYAQAADVRMTLPLVFNTEVLPRFDYDYDQLFLVMNAKPLGKIEKNLDFYKNLPSKRIKVKMLPPQKAMSIYGSEAQGGALIIQTK